MQVAQCNERNFAGGQIQLTMGRIRCELNDYLLVHPRIEVGVVCIAVIAAPLR
jgi:hypothetical protein